MAKNKVGRKPNPITYNELEDSIECIVSFNKNPLKFYIDKDDLDRVKARNWHSATNGKYIGCYVKDNGKIKVLYLHNFIMNKLDFPGRGASQSIDHINRNGLDNRKSNLRLATASEQNVNQATKKRVKEMPDGFTQELPKYMWYVKPRDRHGDRFGIDIKHKNIVWTTTSSTKVSLQEKYTQALQKLDEILNEHPELKILYSTE